MSTGISGAASGTPLARSSDGNLAGARLGPERQVRQAEHLACHRAALRFVGIEQQRIAGRRSGGESQLPAEVGRVLDGGVHSLAGGG